MTFNIVSFFIITGCLNVVLTAEDIVEDSEVQSNIERTVGRSYSLTTCDYSAQVGYTCLTCNRALHCYPGNLAILVDCYGLFRFCRDGRCSRFQGEKCFTDNKLTSPDPALNGTSVIDTNTDATTKLLTEVTEAPTNAFATTIAVTTTRTATNNADATTTTVSANADETTKTATTNADETTKTATTNADETTTIATTNADATTKEATINSEATTTTVT